MPMTKEEFIARFEYAISQLKRLDANEKDYVFYTTLTFEQGYISALRAAGILNNDESDKMEKRLIDILESRRLRMKNGEC